MDKRFGIRDAIGEGYAITRRNLGTIIGTIILYAVIQATVQYIVGKAEQQGIALMLLSNLASFVVSTWLSAGLTLLTVRGVALGRVDVVSLFQGMPYFFRLLGTAILMGLAGMAAVLPMIIALAVYFSQAGPSLETLRQMGENPEVAAAFLAEQGFFLIGMLLIIGVGIVPPFIVATYLGFTNMLVVDKNAGVLDALSGSFSIVQGSVLRLINFSIVLSLLNIAGALCLLVGLLITLPVSAFAYVCVYRNLLRRWESEQGQPLIGPGLLSEPVEVQENHGEWEA